MKQQLDNLNRDKEVMERKLKGFQDRCQELKAQLENEQKTKTANVQDTQRVVDQNDTDMTTDSDSDTDTDDCEGATAKLRPLRVNIKKGKKRTEVYLQKTKKGNVLMDREFRDSDVVQYKYSPPTSKEVYEWSKEVGNVRKDTRSALGRLEALKDICSLSVRDGFSIVSVNLSSADRKGLKEALGETLSGERLTDDRAETEGWKKLKAWCRKAQQQKVDWNEITRCKQKTDERFFSLSVRYGLSIVSVNLSSADRKSLKEALVWLNGLIPEIRKGSLQRRLKDFDSTSVVIQYIDDVLICSEDKTEHERDVRQLLDFMYSKSHRANLEKAQLCQAEVIYLGQSISQGERRITPSCCEAVKTHPIPQTI
uniref:ribonuclease H n=1 Tax=Sinocyclocheilus anshuiensis TaxID=1608454 RepID=A0A671P0Y6_9TELE